LEKLYYYKDDYTSPIARISSRGSGAGLRKEFGYVEVAIKYLRNRRISAQRRGLQWVNG